MVMDRFSKMFKSKSSEKEASPASQGRKRNGYFLELDDDASAPSETDHATKAATPDKVELTPSEPAKPVATAAPVNADKAKEAGTVSASTVKPAKAESTPVKAKSAKLTEPTPTPNEPAKTPDGMTFAPNFLLSPNQNGGRRRPGPSLNPFMDMADQVNTTKAE